MRSHQSRWPAWLVLAVAVLGGTYSFLGLAMLSSLYSARAHSQYRTAAWIYLGVLAVMILLGLGAITLLIRAYRKRQQPRDDGTR
jgi:hypothetical protein